MGTIRRALSNTFYLMSDWFSIIVFGYLFWIILAKLLSTAEVGMFSTVSNIAIFLTTFATLGFNISTTKIISESLQKGKEEYAAGVMRFAIEKVLLACAGISVLLIIGMRIFAPSYLGFWDLVAVSAYVIISSLYLVAQAFLLGFQSMKKIFTTDLFAYAVKIVLTVGLILAGLNYFGPIIAFAIATIAALIWRIKDLKIHKYQIDEKSLWTQSLAAMGGGIGVILFFQSTIVILGLLKSMSDVGIYTLAFMLTTPIRSVFQAVGGAVFPIASGKWASAVSGEKKSVEELSYQALRYSLLFVLPLLMIIFFFSSDILLLFSRPEYVVGSLPMKAIAVASVLFGISQIISIILYSIGDIKHSRNVQMIGGIANTILCFALISAVGILGAAIAYFLSSLLSLLFSAFWFLKKFRFSAAKAFVKFLIPLAVFYAVIYLLKIYVGGLPAIIAAAVFGTAAYFISLLLLRFFEPADIKVLEVLETKAPRLAWLFRIAKKSVKSKEP